jgi:amino acid permease
MSVVAEQSKRLAVLRAFLTIVIVTALVAGALGAVTYAGSRVLVGMLS